MSATPRSPSSSSTTPLCSSDSSRKSNFSSFSKLPASSKSSTPSMPSISKSSEFKPSRLSTDSDMESREATSGSATGSSSKSSIPSMSAKPNLSESGASTRSPPFFSPQGGSSPVTPRASSSVVVSCKKSRSFTDPPSLEAIVFSLGTSGTEGAFPVSGATLPTKGGGSEPGGKERNI